MSSWIFIFVIWHLSVCTLLFINYRSVSQCGVATDNLCLERVVLSLPESLVRNAAACEHWQPDSCVVYMVRDGEAEQSYRQVDDDDDDDEQLADSLSPCRERRETNQLWYWFVRSRHHPLTQQRQHTLWPRPHLLYTIQKHCFHPPQLVTADFDFYWLVFVSPCSNHS